MSLASLPARPPPFRLDAEGVLRIGRTRVTLDSVLGAYDDGCTVEQIVLKYPSLSLAETYAAIAYCLWEPVAVAAYRTARAQQTEETRRQSELRSPMTGVRERLLARQRRAS